MKIVLAISIGIGLLLGIMFGSAYALERWQHGRFDSTWLLAPVFASILVAGICMAAWRLAVGTERAEILAAHEETMTQIRDGKRVKHHSPEAMSQATMDALWPLPRVIPGPYNITQSEIDHANSRIAALREWLKRDTSLSPEEVQAYKGWLDFCEQDNKAAQKSLDTNERQSFEDRWNADRQREKEMIDSVKIHRPPR